MTDGDSAGLVFAGTPQADSIANRLSQAGYRVIFVDGGGVRGFREAQALIADALRLPDSAGRNLDALADSLRDLAGHWPDERRLALVWRDADVLLVRDLPGWYRLTEVLSEASARLSRRPDEPDAVVFQTVLLVDGFGVSG